MVKCVKTNLYEINIFKFLKPHFRLHTHENICICAITKGYIEFENDGETISLFKNQLIVFNAKRPHKIISYEGAENYFIVHLHVDDVFLPKYVDDANEYEKFVSFCEDSIETKNQKYINNFIKKYKLEKTPNNTNKNIKDVKKILDDNVDMNISLSKIAKKVNLNESYLSRSFKKNYGLSPRNYVLNQRINKAKELLDSGLEIVDIAQELGFYDQAHFYKNFKAVYSITPKEYQQMKKQKQ